ncbi:MAG: hypothetical protein OER88_11445 [Planctomycetota bacterium]|nr:hypothetical protein [Planctomycetota bacterium]
MKIFVVTLLVYGLALLGLALGRLFGRPGLRGTCSRHCDVCRRARTRVP